MSQLPRLRPDVEIRRLGDGSFALIAPGAKPTRITERVARALEGLASASDIGRWQASSGVERGQLEVLLASLQKRGLTEAVPRFDEPTINAPIAVQDDFRVHTFDNFEPPNTVIVDQGLPSEPGPPSGASGIEVDVDMDDYDFGGTEDISVDVSNLLEPNPEVSPAATFDVTADVDAPSVEATDEEPAVTAAPEADEAEAEADLSERSAVWDEAEQQVEADVSVTKRRRRRRLGIAARILAVPFLLVAASFVVPWDFNITARCALQPLKSETIRAPRAGVIYEVAVDEGEQVEAGRIIGQLANADFKTAVIKTEARLERARAELELLKAGNRPEDIERARVRVNGLSREVNVASRSVGRLARLVKQGVAPRAQLEQAQQRQASLQGQLSQANADFKLVQAGTRPDELRKKEAELRGIEAQLKLDKEILESTVLRTRLAGVVTTRRPRDLLRTKVSAGDSVFEVAMLDKMRAEIFISERDFDSLTPGLPVGLKVASYPTKLFTGTVQRIAPKIEVIDGQNVVLVEAEIENAERLLVPNMTGFAELNAGQKPIALLVVRRLLRWVRVRFLV